MLPPVRPRIRENHSATIRPFPPNDYDPLEKKPEASVI